MMSRLSNAVSDTFLDSRVHLYNVMKFEVFCGFFEENSHLVGAFKGGYSTKFSSKSACNF